MTNPEGGFYSSLDAYSEGVEGKYYVWSFGEIRVILGDAAPHFERAYGLTATGNCEGIILLQHQQDDVTLSEIFKFKQGSGDTNSVGESCQITGYA